MNLRRSRKHGAEVPTHAMNDIMFFLLLFFLILSTMTNPYMIKIFTASADSKLTKEEIEKKKYELVVTAEKEYLYNNEKVSEEQLAKLLVAEHNMNEKMVLSIDLDPEVDIQEMVDVLSVCTESGIKFYLKDPGV